MRFSDVYKCRLCHETHALRFCPEFLEMDISMRRRTAQANGYCMNCLARSHRTHECTSTAVCQICSDVHHTLLHEDQDSSTSTSQQLDERSHAIRRRRRQPRRDVNPTNNLQLSQANRSNIVATIEQRLNGNRSLSTNDSQMLRAFHLFTQLQEILQVAPMQPQRYAQTRRQRYD